MISLSYIVSWVLEELRCKTYEILQDAFMTLVLQQILLRVWNM